ncbi:MAG: bifunctional (p)ppGpp synthetase/guanosine-3',5'-bis(diphosphate) 3'-pyrophosphohydrolase [Chloroflexi bacterium]|nr:bifunctional (p)ppGpp synthetase/guanosine-3',5'-bis(diphosphate) 3'-pyrophosphohydrolase [Chloroflexota bacterium]
MKDLVEQAKTYLPDDRVELIGESYRFAEQAHEGQKRLSGSPYIQHPLEVATLLIELRLDSNTIAAAMLHDVLEDCGVTQDELAGRFGADITKLVDGVTKLSKIEVRPDQKDNPSESNGRQSSTLQAESLRKMLVAMAEDVRVILIKLADRLHNMRTIRALPPEKRIRIARETLDVYAPLAHRLGISNFKWQLEDTSFRCLDREAYGRISRLLASTRAERERFISRVATTLRKECLDAGVKSDISGRPKHIYSIYQKMQRYSAQGKDFDQIYDLFGFRVLVEDIQSCYRVLGTVHNLWHPIHGEFDDYIANPRENMYQSLHTAVLGPNTTPFEVQIRTFRMHDVAENGIAAHYRYKEGGNGDVRFDERMTWLRQLLDWHQDENVTVDFMESVRTDIFPDQVFVYTPKGEVRELPMGATPIDFAYRIHTELGHRCVGTKVNGKMSPLNRRLQNGDTVDIMVAKGEKGPSLDWLNTDLGYVKTANARDKIKSWFRKQARDENMERGGFILEKELKRLHLAISEKDLAAALGYESLGDLAAALGSGALSSHQLASKVLPTEEPAVVSPDEKQKAPTTTNVMVMGMLNFLTRLADCCHPLEGDRIVGFVTRSRGVTVHRDECRNIHGRTDRDRLIPVSWCFPSRVYTTKVSIEAWDRVGLLRDITTLLSTEGVNIAAVRSTHRKQGTVHEVLTLQTSGAAQLSRLLQRLENIRGVIKVERIG